MYERGAIEDRAAVIAWWEKRRFFYNQVLAGVGTLTWRPEIRTDLFGIRAFRLAVKFSICN